MSLWVTHELGLLLSVVWSLLAVLLSGALPSVAWLALPAALVSSYFRLRHQALRGLWGTLLGLVGITSGLFLVMRDGLASLVLGACFAIVFVLVGRLLTRTESRHDIQALLISLLLVFAGSVMHFRLSYGVLLLLYSVSVVWALLTRQLVDGAHREAKRGGAPAETTLARRDVVTPGYFAASGLIALTLMLSTGVLFAVFPRIGLGRFGFAGNQGTQLPEAVSLTSTPRASLGNQVVARIRGLSREDVARGLYLRGPVYRELENEGFARPMNLSVRAPRVWQRLARQGEPRRYEVFLKPLGGAQLLSLGWVQNARMVASNAIDVQRQLMVGGVGPAGQLYASSPVDTPVRYYVQGYLSAAVEEAPEGDEKPLDDASRALFLQLPKGLDPRVRQLAEELGEGLERDESKVARVWRYLRQNHAYSLTTKAAGAASPLTAFLFDAKEGHCEYFATAMTALLRLLDVPARVVGGFQGGRWDPEGEVAVFTTANAHAWVEWYDPVRGWRLADATPAAEAELALFQGLAAWYERSQRWWDDHVVDYDLGQQFALLQKVTQPFKGAKLSFALPKTARGWAPWVGMGLLLGFLASVGVWLLRRRPWRQDEHPIGLAFEQVYARHGPPGEADALTVRAMAGVLLRSHQALRPEERDLVSQAIRVYERDQFGKAHAAPLRVKRMAQAVREVRWIS